MNTGRTDSENETCCTNDKLFTLKPSEDRPVSDLSCLDFYHFINNKRFQPVNESETLLRRFIKSRSKN